MITLEATEHIQKEDLRFFKITQTAYILGFSLHFLLIIGFWFQGFIEMTIFNALYSIPAFLAAYYLNRNGKLNLAFAIASSELFIHQVLCVYYFGWDMGYQFIFIYLAALIFFNHKWKRSVHIFSIVTLSITTFILHTHFRESTHYIIDPQVSEFNYISSFIFIIIGIAFFANYFAKAAHRSETELENLVKERTAELEQSQRDAITMLGEAGHYNDTDTGVHIWRMADYSALLAKHAGWEKKDVELLKLAAPMHDSGKIGIPDRVLKKPAKLDRDEWEVMQSHSEVGYNILKQSDTPLFKLAAEVALYHHEKYDGSGYPKKLKGEEIPQSARIVAIADVFDALTMKRPYKEAWSVDDALDEIKKCAGGHFDPELALIFIEQKEELLGIKAYWDNKELH